MAKRFGPYAVHHQLSTVDRTNIECPPEGMHRPLRPTEMDAVHEDLILASPQSVSGHAQLILRLRMQQLAHVMRLRALTIVKTPGRDRFSTISSLTSSAG